MRADLLIKLMGVYTEIAEDMRDRMLNRRAAEAATEPASQSETPSKTSEVQGSLSDWSPGEREAQAARIEQAIERLNDALCGRATVPAEGIPLGRATVRMPKSDRPKPVPGFPRRVTLTDDEGVVFEMTDDFNVTIPCAGRPDRLTESMALLTEAIAMATRIVLPPRPSDR